MPWEKGQSGNPGGRPNNKPFFTALNRAILQDDHKRLRAAAEALLDKASAGEPWAIKELADRLDGKSIQAISGDPENPLNFVAVVRREIVKSPTTTNG